MNIVHRALRIGVTLALGMSFGATSVGAQAFVDPGIPNYTQWQKKWDTAAFHNPHVIVGEVIDFHPYRVRVRRSNGVTQSVDLKRGTRILPIGATPTPGERVGLVGYYSHGTFIVNRLVVR
jgi:hypothetical protein